MEGIIGSIDKQIVFKKSKGSVLVTKYPICLKVVPITKQSAVKQKFKEVVVYTKGLLKDPETHHQLIKKHLWISIPTILPFRLMKNLKIPINY